MQEPENTERETHLTETPVSPKSTERPDPAWVRGKCPKCGEVVISNLYYVGGKGYLLKWQCWASLGENPTCNYQKVL